MENIQLDRATRNLIIEKLGFKPFPVDVANAVNSVPAYLGYEESLKRAFENYMHDMNYTQDDILRYEV